MGAVILQIALNDPKWNGHKKYPTNAVPRTISPQIFIRFALHSVICKILHILGFSKINSHLKISKCHKIFNVGQLPGKADIPSW